MDYVCLSVCAEEIHQAAGRVDVKKKERAHASEAGVRYAVGVFPKRKGSHC